MASLTSVLDIAKTALLTNQKAINVASHNISNANTPGYTRQMAVIEPMDDVAYGGLFFGTGVKITNIQRSYDNFLAVQLRDGNSALSRFQSKEGIIKSLEAAMNDLGGTGIRAPLDGFFNSLQDMANNPSTYGERSAVLSSATVLADTFNRIDTSIRQGIINNNGEMEAKVREINSLSSRIADLNIQISSIELSGTSANDLRDKRDVLLDGLSKLIDIKTMEGSSGQVDVYVAGGSSLVAGAKTAALEVAVSATNPSLYDLKSNGTVVTDRIAGGSIMGLIEGNKYYLDVQTKLNTMSASIAKTINLQHRQGYGLDSSTGQDLFALPTVYMSAGANTGGASISGGTITSLSQLTLNDYEVRFYSPTNYNVVNKATGATIVSGGAYTSGNTITLPANGLSFVITNGSTGPVAGDTFTISVTKNAAQNMRVALTDPNKIAASSALATLPGDNTNALALARIKDSNAINGLTFSQYYAGVVSDLGVKANEASGNHDAQKRIVEQLQNSRDAASGVSIEEEAISLIKYQRAYEAAAKVISTADKMLETLINIR